MPTTSPATSTMLPEVLLDTPTCSPTGCLNISNPETHDLLVNTLGGCVVETLISCILYGVLIVQAYSYFRDFERDSLPLKGLVLATSFLESIQFLCDIHQTYHYAIISSYALLIGDISSMQHISWSVYLANVVQLLTVALVHGCYITRVWIISKGNWPGSLLLGALSFVRAALHLTTIIYMAQGGSAWSTFFTSPKSFMSLEATYYISASADIIITIATVYFVRRSRKNFSWTNKTLRMLTWYSINSGLIIAGFSLTIAITFAHFGNSMIFYGFGNFSTQVYGNALLGLLNARSVLRSKNDTYHFSVGADGVELAQLRPMRIEIFKETSQITVVDELNATNISRRTTAQTVCSHAS